MTHSEVASTSPPLSLLHLARLRARSNDRRASTAANFERLMVAGVGTRSIAAECARVSSVAMMVVYGETFHAVPVLHRKVALVRSRSGPEVHCEAEQVEREEKADEPLQYRARVMVSVPAEERRGEGYRECDVQRDDADLEHVRGFEVSVYQSVIFVVRVEVSEFDGCEYCGERDTEDKYEEEAVVPFREMVCVEARYEDDADSTNSGACDCAVAQHALCSPHVPG